MDIPVSTKKYYILWCTLNRPQPQRVQPYANGYRFALWEAGRVKVKHDIGDPALAKISLKYRLPELAAQHLVEKLLTGYGKPEEATKAQVATGNMIITSNYLCPSCFCGRKQSLRQLPECI